MAKAKKINQAEESLNEKTDISTPLSEFGEAEPDR